MGDTTNRERALVYLKEQGIAEVHDDRPLTPWTDKQAAKLTALLDAAEQRGAMRERERCAAMADATARLIGLSSPDEDPEVLRVVASLADLARGLAVRIRALPDAPAEPPR